MNLPSKWRNANGGTFDHLLPPSGGLIRYSSGFPESPPLTMR